MSARYTVAATADIALVGATAKTVLTIINPASGLVRITELSIGFDGTNASAEAVTVELCYSTQAGAGTPGSSPTPQQVGGPTRTVEATAGLNYSAEPTVLTVWKTWLLDPKSGGLVLQGPLGRETEQNVTQDALAIRCTAPVAVNCRPYIEFEEG